MNILTLIIIGLSLSMDTFSLALSLGTFNIPRKRIISFSFFVGLFHFIMPILGGKLGSLILDIINIESHKLLSIIFIFIAIEMLLSLFSKEDKSINLNIFNQILYAFSVSLDSFTIGIVLLEITSIPLLASIIFALISFSFTFMGLYLGKFSYHKIGKLSKVVGFIIITLLAIINLFH